MSGYISEKSIPHSLHDCGYNGIAQAICFMALWDIVKEIRSKLNRGEDQYSEPFSHEYMTAESFLKRKRNVLYTLDIPGEELMEKVIKETINDWNKRKR